MTYEDMRNMPIGSLIYSEDSNKYALYITTAADIWIYIDGNTPHFGFEFHTCQYDVTNMSYVTGCEHTWKEYKGLMEHYEYCSVCDEKRVK